MQHLKSHADHVPSIQRAANHLNSHCWISTFPKTVKQSKFGNFHDGTLDQCNWNANCCMMNKQVA